MTIKELFKQAFDSGYDYRTSLMPEVIKEYGENCAQTFEEWYDEQKLNIHGVSGKQPYYQLCPKCAGEGQVPNIGTTSSLFRICPVCNGSRTLYVDPSMVACASGAANMSARVLRVASVPGFDASGAGHCL